MHKAIKEIFKLFLIFIIIFLSIIGCFFIMFAGNRNRNLLFEKKIDKHEALIEVRYVEQNFSRNTPYHKSRDDGYLILKNGKIKEFDKIKFTIGEDEIQMTKEELARIKELINDIDEKNNLCRYTAYAVNDGLIITIYDGDNEIVLKDFYCVNNSTAATEILEILYDKLNLE